MTTNNQYSAMTSSHGQPLALQTMELAVQVQDAFALVEQTQRWHNSEAVNIEAVYHFPLPVQACLLGVSVSLNDRLIVAEVAESRQAEQTYEQAMLDGNTAMLLEQVEPGLYTLNLGNLLPDDSASICIRYALPLDWEGRQMRLALPTTVAPRFGNAAAAGLQPHQIPQSDISVEHSYRLDMTLSGELAKAGIGSPSHAIRLSAGDNLCRVSFANGSAAADRDLVIILTSSDQPPASARLVSVGQNHLLHAAFPIPSAEKAHPLNLKILVDCSGSMLGDSMVLARKTAQRALLQLKPGDHYALSAFGSTLVHAPGNQQQMLTVGSQGLDPQSLRFTRHLQADLGGTDMVPALQGVFALSAHQGDAQSADVLLITDGETWERDTIVRLCRQSRHRVFVIGCGACPAESVVREIAEATGGAAVFVSPNECVTAVVDRHLQRMRQPRIRNARLSLAGSLWQAPAELSHCTFAGSTLHLFAALPAAINGPLQLQLTYADGQSQAIDSQITACPTAVADDLLRMGINAHIRESLFGTDCPDTGELTRLAVEHQLISPYTHYVMVEQRGANAASEDPQLRQIPGMLAAGWGGTGLSQTKEFLDVPAFLRRAVLVEEDEQRFTLTSVLHCIAKPRFFSRGGVPSCSPAKMIEHLNGDYSLLQRNSQPHLTLSKLTDLCNTDSPLLDPAIREDLEELLAAGWTERDVLLAFWQALLEAPVLKELFNRGQRRAIMRELDKALPPIELQAFFAKALLNCSKDCWSWEPEHGYPQFRLHAQTTE